MQSNPLQLHEQLNSVNPYILESAVAYLDWSWHLNLSNTPYSRLYYVYEGEAWIESGGKHTVMKKGHFYFVPAGLPFTAGCPESAKKIYFHLNLLKRDGYDLAMDLHQIAELPVNSGRLTRLEALCQENSVRSSLLLKTLLMEDILTVFSAHDIGGDSTATYSLPVRKTVKYIRSHLSIGLSVHMLAERQYLSERTLNNAFRREMGKTVGQYIDEMVMIEAQRRLLLTDLSIGEISEALGFCDQFYFARRFKERCGKTPTAYRKEGRNK